MAVMSRGKQSNKLQWALNQKKRDQASLKAIKEVKKEITPEDHEERIRKLKELGLIK